METKKCKTDEELSTKNFSIRGGRAMGLTDNQKINVTARGLMAKMLSKIRNKKEKEAFDVASKALKVTHLIHEIDSSYLFKYLNLSINSYTAEDAPEALLVMHQSHELAPHPRGLAGSTPAWGASAFILDKQNMALEANGA